MAPHHKLNSTLPHEEREIASVCTSTVSGIEKWVPCTAHATTQQPLSAMDLIRLLQERIANKVHGGGM